MDCGSCQVRGQANRLSNQTGGPLQTFKHQAPAVSDTKAQAYLTSSPSTHARVDSQAR